MREWRVPAVEAEAALAILPGCNGELRIRPLQIFGVVEEMEATFDPIDVAADERREMVCVGHTEIIDRSKKCGVEWCRLLELLAGTALPRQRFSASPSLLCCWRHRQFRQYIANARNVSHTFF